jgi:hypothetical protein
MPWYMLSVVGLAVVSVFISPVIGQEPVAKPKAKVELFWLEDKSVTRLTQEKGFQTTCDPKSIVYQHIKPVIVLGPSEVTEVSWEQTEMSQPGGIFSEYHLVTLHLTKEARKTIAAAYEDDVQRSIMLTVDGSYHSIFRYAKGKAATFGVPEQRCAETFLPEVSFFSIRGEKEATNGEKEATKAQAERLVDAFK